MAFFEWLISETWIFLAKINYALIDFIVAEIIGLVIEKKRHFKKSEFYIFLMILAGILFFFLSNTFQDFLISYFIILKAWLLIIFIIIFSVNVFILAKFDLDRRWGFRLVWIPLTIIGVIILFLIIYLIIRYKP